MINGDKVYPKKKKPLNFANTASREVRSVGCFSCDATSSAIPSGKGSSKIILHQFPFKVFMELSYTIQMTF